MSFENVRSISATPVSATLIPARRFVTVTTAGEVTLATASGDAIGISLEASPANSSVVIPVALLDGAKIEVEANAAIAAGTPVAAAGAGADAGRADDTTAAVTVKFLGYALTAAGAAGEVITIIGSKSAGFAAQS